jgi:HEAT repeat protein
MRMWTGLAHRFLLATLVVTLGPIVASVAAAPPDVVEELRQVLKTGGDEPVTREHLIQEQVQLLDDVHDLCRALVLREWRDEDPSEQVSSVDRRQRGIVARRFEQRVREIFRREDAGSRLAALHMIAKMGADARGVGTRRSAASALTQDLVDMMNRGDSRTRQAAVRALGQINPDPAVAVPALRVLLRAPDLAQKRAAGEALVSLMRVVAQLATHNQVSTGVETTRTDVVNMGCAVIPLAGAGLHDSEAEVRRRCTEAIGQAADGLHKLVSAHRSGEGREEQAEHRRQIEQEREELAPLIRALRDQVPALTRALGDADAEVRLLARRALEDMTHPQLRLMERATALDRAGLNPAAPLGPAQFTQIGIKSDPVREGLQEMVQAVAAGIKDRDVRVRRAAIDVLETLGPAAAPAAGRLVEALADRDVFVRWSAARTLGKVSPAQAALVVPALAHLLTDLDLDLRLAATTALERYGPAARAAVPDLLVAMRCTDAEVRMGAIRTLGAVGEPSAHRIVPALAEALTDSDARVREMAAVVLGKFGPAAREAADVLERALQDRNADVQKASGEALLKVRKPTRN